MTAQEIYEREGFLPLASLRVFEVGQVIRLTPDASGVFVRFDTQVKVVGILTEREFRKLETYYLKYLPGAARSLPGSNFYKVVAE